MANLLPLGVMAMFKLFRDNAEWQTTVVSWVFTIYVIVTLVRLTFYVIAFVAKSSSIAMIVATATSAAVCATLAYGVAVTRADIVVEEFEICHKDIPAAFDGYKIVHFSDLHIGSLLDAEREIDNLVEIINRQEGDLVVFSGDLVHIRHSELSERVSQKLSAIQSRDGVVAVLGNHDFMIYGFDGNLDREKAVDDLADFQTNVLGWNLLRNESIVIAAEDSSKITFIGVDNANYCNQGFRTIHRGDLKKAMAGTEGFRTLLSHDPSHWNAEVIPDTDIPLTLSGHTHSAQISFFGWSPAKWSFNEIAGRYDKGNQTLYINVGLGCTAPFRIGVNPEVTVMTLRSVF